MISARARSFFLTRASADCIRTGNEFSSGFRGELFQIMNDSRGLDVWMVSNRRPSAIHSMGLVTGFVFANMDVGELLLIGIEVDLLLILLVFLNREEYCLMTKNIKRASE